MNNVYINSMTEPLNDSITPPGGAPWARDRAREFLPGLCVALLATLAAGYLSDHYGAPLTLMALLIGMALNFLSTDERLAPGLAFASKTLLRIGIVLAGARITLVQVTGLGLQAYLAIALIMGVTMLGAVMMARRLELDSAFGVVAGGAVAICGASAAMAIAAVLGERRFDQARLASVLVGISVMSSLAMFAYPIAVHLLGLDDLKAGFVIGASIHDVAQAIGAGHIVSPAAGETAAIVKLTRVAMLAPVLALVSLCFNRAARAHPGIAPLPWFVLGFFVMAAINSAGAISPLPARFLTESASALLACAIAATAIGAPMHALFAHGSRGYLVMLTATIIAFANALIAASIVF